MSENACLPETIQKLQQQKKEGVPCYLYIDSGTQLFTNITRSPDYYLTHSEKEVLSTQADQIIHCLLPQDKSQKFNIIETGCGNGEKAEIFIKQMLDTSDFSFNYIGIDFSQEMINTFTSQLQQYASDKVSIRTRTGLNDVILTDLFKDDKKQLDGLPTIVLFFGASISQESKDDNMMHTVSKLMHDEDRLLVGFDLIKENSIMNKAYNCPEFAAFTTNYLSILNSTLNGDFDLDAFRFESVWDYQEYQQSHYLTSLKDQVVTFKDYDVKVPFFKFENIRVWKSAKHNTYLVKQMACSANLVIDKEFRDSKNYFTDVIFKKKFK